MPSFKATYSRKEQMLAKTNTIPAQLGLGKPDAKYSIFSPANLQLFHTYYYTLNVKSCPFYSCFIAGSHCFAQNLCLFIPFVTFLLQFFRNTQKSSSNPPKSQTNLKTVVPHSEMTIPPPGQLTAVIPCTLCSLSVSLPYHTIFFTEVLPAHNKAQLSPEH